MGGPPGLGPGEIDWWMAYYQLEPFGPIQEDLRAAYLTAMFQQAHRGKRDRAMKPEDFFPSLRPRKKPQTDQDMRFFAYCMTLAMKGDVVGDVSKIVGK